MRDKQTSREAESSNFSPMLPDSYELISKERGRSITKINSRVMEFIHESGAAFTLYEKRGTGFVGCLSFPEQGMSYFEVVPNKVVVEETDWSGPDCQLLEPAVLPLLYAGWQLTYYNEKHTKKQMYEIFNGEGLSISSSQG